MKKEKLGSNSSFTVENETGNSHKAAYFSNIIIDIFHHFQLQIFNNEFGKMFYIVKKGI